MIQKIWSVIRNKLLGFSIGWTLSAILLLGLVPSFVMGRYFVGAQQQSIAEAENELAGVALLRELQPVGKFLDRLPLNDDAKRAAAKKILLQFNTAMENNHIQIARISKHLPN